MTAPTLRLAPGDRRALAHEFEAHLQHGRAFTNDAVRVEVLADCVLVLVHPDSARELKLPAQAVMVTPAGIGIELRPFDDTIRERIREFIGEAGPQEAREQISEPRHAEEDSIADAQRDAVAEPEDANPQAEDEQTEGEQAAPEQAEDEDAAPEANGVQSRRPRHEQLRRLSSAQQAKLARKGELNDRVILERLYGKNVWEPLLHNPRLTVPEVARIARKGTVPRPLLELIAENNTWIQAPVVRRALLGNPRVTGETIMKLLRVTPKHELKVIVKTTTYSTQVRDAAKKLLS